jgi:hypothetical protein
MPQNARENGVPLRYICRHHLVCWRTEEFCSSCTRKKKFFSLPVELYLQMAKDENRMEYRKERNHDQSQDRHA